MAKYKLRRDIEAEQYVHNDALEYLKEWAGSELHVDNRAEPIIYVGLHRVRFGEFLVKTDHSLIVMPESQFNELFEKTEDAGIITTGKL